MGLQYIFGTGTLAALRNDVANSTPVVFGGLQDVSIDFSFTQKELWGQNQFPIDTARGEGKITIKAKYAQISGLVYNNVFFGQSTSTTINQMAVSEAATVPSTPYQITVAQAATFADDCGVVLASTGLPLKKVASAPATGQYSVSNVGVYTFAAADTTNAVLITYTYTTATAGTKISGTNLIMGSAPTFKMDLFRTYKGNVETWTFNQCIATKLSLPSKFNDYTLGEVDVSSYADASGNVFTVSTTQ